MRKFLDYQSMAKQLNFSVLPYSKVKIIIYVNAPPAVSVQYGLSFEDEDRCEIDAVNQQTARKTRRKATDRSESETATLSLNPLEQQRSGGKGLV